MERLPAPAGPRRLTFVTSPDRCNLACRMCREHSPLAPRRTAAALELPSALVWRVLDERRGTALREVIPSTMGEPLLWEALPELAARCAADGLALNVTTNGTFPRLGPEAWGEVLGPAARDVKLSWNAARPDTAAAVMGGLDLARALDDLRRFLAVRDRLRAAGRAACRVTFQVTAQEENVAELPDVVRLAAALGVERVKVNQLQVHFEALASSDLRRTAAGRARWNAAVAAMRAAARSHPLPWGEHVLLESVDPWPSGELPPFGECPFVGQEAWIAADGRFEPCPAAAAHPRLLGDLGSLHERTLGEIWGGEPLRALVRDRARHAPCARCAFRRPGGV